jgi:hypothetical protein
MADTAVGLADDANAIYYNPAGLATVRKLELNAMYFDNIVDTKDEAISVVNPLRRGITGRKAAFGAGVKAYQGGDMEVIMADNEGIETRHATIAAESDYMAVIGYAEEIIPNICLGLALKGIRSTLVEEYNATAYAFDVGLLYRTPLKGLHAGFSMQNNGSEMKFIEEGDSLPTRYATGIGYMMYPLSSALVKAGADYIKEREIDAATNVGLELMLFNMISLRGGYYTKSDLGSVTMGLGVKAGMIQLDYGYGMMDELGNLQRASITMRWSGAEKMAQKPGAMKTQKR